MMLVRFFEKIFIWSFPLTAGPSYCEHNSTWKGLCLLGGLHFKYHRVSHPSSLKDSKSQMTSALHDCVSDWSHFLISLI